MCDVGGNKKEDIEKLAPIATMWVSLILAFISILLTCKAIESLNSFREKSFIEKKLVAYEKVFPVVIDYINNPHTKPFNWTEQKRLSEVLITPLAFYQGEKVYRSLASFVELTEKNIQFYESYKATKNLHEILENYFCPYGGGEDRCKCMEPPTVQEASDHKDIFKDLSDGDKYQQCEIAKIMMANIRLRAECLKLAMILETQGQVGDKISKEINEFYRKSCER